MLLLQAKAISSNQIVTFRVIDILNSYEDDGVVHVYVAGETIPVDIDSITPVAPTGGNQTQTALDVLNEINNWLMTSPDFDLHNEPPWYDNLRDAIITLSKNAADTNKDKEQEQGKFFFYPGGVINLDSIAQVDTAMFISGAIGVVLSGVKAPGKFGCVIDSEHADKFLKALKRYNGCDI